MFVQIKCCVPNGNVRDKSIEQNRMFVLCFLYTLLCDVRNMSEQKGRVRDYFLIFRR